LKAAITASVPASTAALKDGGKPRDARAERRGFGQRHRKLGAEAVQHVEAEQERDTEAALPGKALGAGDVLGVVEVDQRADPARGQIVPVQGLAVGDQVELPDLFVQRHAGEEIVHPRLHIEPLRHAGHGRDPVLALGLGLRARSPQQGSRQGQDTNGQTRLRGQG
jgi:hypothetical protein